MIFEYYNYIYLLLVVIVTISMHNRCATAYSLNENNSSVHPLLSLAVVLIFTFFIGLRGDSDVFADSHAYIEMYYQLEGMPFSIDTSQGDPLFYNLLSFIASYRLGWNCLFVTIAFLYFGCTYLGIRKIFPGNELAAYAVFLGAFSTYSFSVNGLRAGLAASFFIWAIANRENVLKCMLLLLCSYGFHHSMQLPILAFVLTAFYNNPKAYLAFWLVCLILSIAHVSYFQNIFASLTDESGARYLKTDSETFMKGFRPDFILYSLVPVWLGYRMVVKNKIDISKSYKRILNTYMLTNGVWMLCMYSNFTNRIAYLSWILYPILLVHPFLNEDIGEQKYSYFNRAMSLHLLFTVSMSVVYYGLLSTK